MKQFFLERTAYIGLISTLGIVLMASYFLILTGGKDTSSFSSKFLLQYVGFIEGNRIFRNDADVIVTDGFTGNVALKAAEGVADIYGSSGGMKRFFSKMARPEWLLPWQYNGSVLLGVNGVVVKSHASAGVEAFAVAVVEAARAAQASLAENMQRRLSKD